MLSANMRVLNKMSGSTIKIQFVQILGRLQ